MTKYQIAEVCYLAPRNVGEYLKMMYENLEVYVHSYIRTGQRGGSWTKVWAYGNGKDALRPRARTPTERARKRREDPEVAIDEMMKKRAKRFAERMARRHEEATIP